MLRPLACLLLLVSAVVRAERPNVLLIVCDDLNDYVTGWGGHPQARTPHLERLADSGVAFRHAYSNDPICAPSRSSFLTGIYPHTSGNFFFDKWFENPVLKRVKTLMELFRDNGYHTAGTGKLMHHHRPGVWSEFGHRADYGPFVYDGTAKVAHPHVPRPFHDIGPVDGSFASLADVPFAHDGKPASGWIYGRWGQVVPFHYTDETHRDPTPDERNAGWVAAKLAEFAATTPRRPFFLAVGFIRPHTPLHVPQAYFDRFPLETVSLPRIRPGDAADCHYLDVYTAEQKGPRYFRLLGASYPEPNEGLRAFTRAYLASVAAVDDCIGRVLDALDQTGLRDKTLVVVTSDHGWTMGQKDYLFKNALWEESTRVPLIVRAPGMTPAGAVVETPVSLIDLYPTFVDLCGLQGSNAKTPQGPSLDGHSLRPLLADPVAGRWDGPEGALTVIYAGNSRKRPLTPVQRNDPRQQHWSLRTARWRYIRYADGSEELYDHDADPYEWTNLADDPHYASLKGNLARRIRARIGR